MLNEWIKPILTAALGSVAFAMFFGIRSPKLLLSALGGALTWGTYLIGMYFSVNEPVCYMLGAMIGTLYAEILARIVKTPVTVFIITSVIPLVPGGALYYAMLGLMRSDTPAFIDRGVYALSAAGAMALGMFAATMLFRIIMEAIRSTFLRH